MQLLFATSNPHKLEEVRAILGSAQVEVIGLGDLEGQPAEPVEDGASFAENARKKAMHYARATGRLCLADDSGLEVDALDGEPGVFSARYAGKGATRAERDRANNNKLLSRLGGVPPEQRTARFVCSMCLADSKGNLLGESRGTFDGVIADEPRGESGFGYDPLLYLPDAGRTVAELSADEKNARSHRGEAAREIAARIRQLTSPQAPPI
jgi:XTP/dITP diphosphohydrolase